MKLTNAISSGFIVILFASQLFINAGITQAQTGGRTEFPDRKTFWEDCNNSLRGCGRELSCDMMDGRNPVVPYNRANPCTVKSWSSQGTTYTKTEDCICGKKNTLWTISELFVGSDENGKECAKKKDESTVFLESGGACTGGATTNEGKAREKRLCPPPTPTPRPTTTPSPSPTSTPKGTGVFTPGGI